MQVPDKDRAVTTVRQRLPDRRCAETFELEVGALRYTATVGRFSDGSIGELFLSNHKNNSAADCNARDAAIVFSFAVQCGADPEAIRRALCRDSQGRASGPLAAALDVLLNREFRGSEAFDANERDQAAAAAAIEEPAP